jgi:hypothetical protein
MNDVAILAVTIGFGLLTWLLLVISEWLMGDNPQ